MYAMNYFLAAITPCLFFISFLYAARKRVRVYESFTEGMKGAIPLIISIFPYIAAVTLLSSLLEISGMQAVLYKILSPVLSLVGVPKEIFPLLFVKPLSGSGAIAVLSDILGDYGVDSYIGRCACAVYGSSETVFYIGTVYFCGIKRKKLTFALLIALFCYALAVVFCCFLCRFL